MAFLCGNVADTMMAFMCRNLADTTMAFLCGNVAELRGMCNLNDVIANALCCCREQHVYLGIADVQYGNTNVS